jgi:hypothetical protein
MVSFVRGLIDEPEDGDEENEDKEESKDSKTLTPT